MFKHIRNRIAFGAIASILLLAGYAGYALAQTGALGGIQTSPVVVNGFFPFNGGPQASIVEATGGTTTANGSTAVTVTNSNVTANSVVLFGLKTVGGTINGGPYMVTVTPGTGFTFKSGSTDTSVYNYIILG